MTECRVYGFIIANLGAQGFDFSADGLTASVNFFRRAVEQGQFLFVPEDDADMFVEFDGSFQNILITHSIFNIFIQLVIKFAQFALLSQHFFRRVRFGGRCFFNFGRQAGDMAYIFTQFEIKHNKTGGKLFLHYLSQGVVHFSQLFFNDALKRTGIECFQCLRMDANVAEHEFRAQQADLKVGYIAQA